DAETKINPIVDDDGKVNRLTLVMRDITERKRSEQTIHHLAYHDTRTDLPHRRMFMNRIFKEVRQATRPNSPFAVMFLDLDKLKNVNDSLGHEAGDQVLIEMSKRIQSCIPRNSLAARLGGDEFVVLLKDFAKLEEVEALSKRIQSA